MADFEQDRAAAEIERSAEDFTIDPSTAVQNLRDFMLTQIRQIDTPWFKLREAQQRDIAAACEYAAEQAVREIVEQLASRGQQPVRVLLKTLQAGEKIKIVGEAVLIGPEDPDQALLMLHHAIGKHVMLTRATVDDYKQGGRAETDRDEPEIDFEAQPGVNDTDEQMLEDDEAEDSMGEMDEEQPANVALPEVEFEEATEEEIAAQTERPGYYGEEEDADS